MIWEPYRPGSPGGQMKCPRCGWNTPDNWQLLIAELKYPDASAKAVESGILLRQLVETHLEDTFKLAAAATLSFDRMSCAAENCGQLVVRGHLNYRKADPLAPEWITETWNVYPRNTVRPVNELVPEPFKTDYGEAAALVDISPRMAAVLARSIFADLLETYLGLADFDLNKKIDKFRANESEPKALREGAHHFREIGNFGAHTQKNDQDQAIPVEGEDAEWMLDYLERFFDYYIIGPAKDSAVLGKWDKNLEAAGRKPIEPLPDAGESA